MIRRASTSLLIAMAICAAPATARTQSFGVWNSALTSHTVDAAALGTSGRAFLEYGISDAYGYTAEAGLGTLGGMLRATYAHSYSQSLAGLGYARMLAAKNSGKLGTWGAGVDATVSMDFHQPAAIASRAARLAIPLSLRWGSPSRLSIAPYVAPYGEIGREMTYRLNCDQGFFCGGGPVGNVGTHAFGLAAGLQLTAWRLSLEMGLRDIPKREFGSTTYKFGTGLRLSF